MTTIFVSDIFGRTPELECLAQEVTKDYRIIDPYDSVNKSFKSEQAAYQYFQDNVGLDTYSSHIDEQLSLINGHISVVAFSMGASALWNISIKQSLSDKIIDAVGFYGSQIRKLTEITPCFPIELVFPAHEAHFDINVLIEQLSSTQKVSIRQVPYLHGFMNALSPNFDSKGYKLETRALSTHCS